MKYCFLNTDIGECAISWKEESITGFILPEDSQESLVNKINVVNIHEHCENPPQFINDLCQLFVKYFQGEKVDFSRIEISYLSESDFFKDVWNEIRKIPYGEVLTYQEVANLIGNPKSQQAIGKAMSKNPITIIIPCHRVIAKKAIGGFSSHQGVQLKKKLLQLEGVKVNGANQLDLI